jgi:hypothetical protein
VMLNTEPVAHDFELPLLDKGRTWHRVVDTMLKSPRDIAEPGKEPEVRGRIYPVGPQTVVMLLGR